MRFKEIQPAEADAQKKDKSDYEAWCQTHNIRPSFRHYPQWVRAGKPTTEKEQ